MELEDLNDKINVLETSPIRQHLKRNNNKLSLFEDERVILSDIDKIIKINKENLYNPLKVVVLGEVKAGKSTLVNSLIGKKVSYTNVVEATADILEIKYCKEEKIIIKQNNNEKINLHSLDELDNLINLNRGNKEFFERINNIIIFTNTERLKEITLVDTPGLNTVTRENAERTDNYIVNADLILWILNSNNLGQSDVSEKIEDVLDYGKPIICVLNRIDEVNGDTSELIAYVESEMGYMFLKVFAISAQTAWNGFIEKDSSKVNESNINELYEYIVNNIERNSKQVQMNSVLESINFQIERDLSTHKKIKSKIDNMMMKFNEDLDELKEFNCRVKKIVSNKISEWIDRKFFEEQKNLLIDCNDEEFINLVKKFSSDEYICHLINYQYEEINNYLLDEWRNNTEQFIKKGNLKEIETSTINNSLHFIKEMENTNNSKEVVEGSKQGGITAGAIGLGLAGYAAWLGPAAAYVTIGSAITAFFPPLLIAGVIGGGIWKFVSKDKGKKDRHNQTNELISDIKNVIKNNVIRNMENNLYEASDCYYNNSASMIMSILQQCNTSEDELKKIDIELDNYIAESESNNSVE